MASTITLSISYHFIIFLLFFLCLETKATSDVPDIPIHTFCDVPNHDYINLTALTWYIDLKQPHCLPLRLSNGTKQIPDCRVLMKFCQRLTSVGNACLNSSVCQQSLLGSMSLGAYEEYPFIFSLNASQVGFGAYFTDGTTYQTKSNVTCELSTLINFRCNRLMMWEAPTRYIGIKKAPDPILVEYNAETCELKLSFEYAGACPWRIKTSYTSLSVGTVLLLIFVTTVVLYLILGSLLNVAKGKSGEEIIPHVTFWSSLPFYIMDGIKYVSCCGRKPVRAVAYNEIK